jgi:Flp pilus assembly secretin CpaC
MNEIKNSFYAWLTLFFVSLTTVYGQDVDLSGLKKTFDQEYKGYVQENITIPVKDVTNALLKIDNKSIVIDGYWVFKDPEDPKGTVLKEPIILSQPDDLTGQFVFALRAPGVSYVEVTEEGIKKTYRVQVFSRFKENDIEKELETAIIQFVGDPGLKVKILPPQSALVGANLTRSFGSETSSEILAPRGETNGNATGQLLSSSDFRPTIVLSGEVENELVADKALSMAGSYSTNIVNLLSIRNYLQVKIKVKVIRVDQTEDTTIGLQHRGATVTGADGQTKQGFGLGFTSSAPFFETVNGLPIFGDVAQPFGGGVGVRTNVNLAKINGKATLLQEPTLTVLNGQPAEFNVGSLVPFTTTTRDASGLITQSTIFNQIGVTLRVLPLVSEERTARPDAAGLIPITGITGTRTGVGTAASGGGAAIGGANNDLIRTIDDNGVLKMVVQPSIVNFGAVVDGSRTFDTNFVETRVAIRSGQSLVIGGLFSDSFRKDIESIPFVEKIPIIGELFKNRTNSKAKTELVFVLQPDVIGLKSWNNPSLHDTANSYEQDTQNMDVRLAEVEKILTEQNVKKSKAKPVRISASNVTPRTVTIMEPTASDFPPISLETSAPAPVMEPSGAPTSSSSSALTIRPEETAASPTVEAVKEEAQAQ